MQQIYGYWQNVSSKERSAVSRQRSAVSGQPSAMMVGLAANSSSKP
ncbi:MAG: hypothetical protein KME42_06650 [Tildeniella nuda ZEHNDER 1965/U140]|nr:hypothetical protein [Tildeniella nuda ZEHNDER 1965/U140]